MMHTVTLWALVVWNSHWAIGYNYYPTKEACEAAAKVVMAYPHEQKAPDWFCIENSLPYEPSH